MAWTQTWSRVSRELAWVRVSCLFVAFLIACGGAPSSSEEGEGGEGGGGDGGGDGEGGASGQPGNQPASCRIELRAPMRRLSRTEYANTVTDVLGVAAKPELLPDDEPINGYAVNGVVSLGQKDVQDYAASAEDVAGRAMGKLGEWAGCDLAQNECRDTFLTRAGRALFRRPLGSDEAQAFRAAFDGKRAQSSGAEAARLIVEAMLQSPSFLYRPEIGSDAGGGMVKLGPFEVASRLAYFLWASAPDAELLDAAEKGSLAGPDGVRTQAKRMIADGKFKRSLASFQWQWLGMDRAFEARDGERYAGYDEAVWSASRKEAAAVAEHFYLERKDATVKDLLSAPFTFGDAALAKIYGAKAPAGGWGRIDLDPARRVGPATSTGFLTAMATQRTTSTIRRGVFLRENLLCQHPPPPPPGTMVETPEDDGKTTVRSRLERHRSDPQCATCHAFFDPLGLALETYGAIGEWRDVDNGQPIDPRGVLTGTDLGESVTFESGAELLERLAETNEARDCLPEQWLRYAIGRATVDSDQCAVDKLRAEYGKGKYRFTDLLVALAASDLMRWNGARLTEEE